MFDSIDSSPPARPVPASLPDSSADAPVELFDQRFQIIADSERPITPLRVLKHGDSFGVFDARGDYALVIAGCAALSLLATFATWRSVHAARGHTA